MLASLSIAALLLATLTAVGICGLIRHGIRSAAPHNDLRRVGEHPAPTAYDPGAAYAGSAGVTGGGAL